MTGGPQPPCQGNLRFTRTHLDGLVFVPPDPQAIARGVQHLQVVTLVRGGVQCFQIVAFLRDGPIRAAVLQECLKRIERLLHVGRRRGATFGDSLFLPGGVLDRLRRGLGTAGVACRRGRGLLRRLGAHGSTG